MKLFLQSIVFTASLFGVGVVESQIVNQNSVDKYGCGSCSIINSLNHADQRFRKLLDKVPGGNNLERAKHVLEEYGKRPSLSYAGKTRFTSTSKGISCVDLAATLNQVLKDTDSDVTVAGMYLHRGEDEPPVDQLKRVHGMFHDALELGLPVILSVRSFAAKLNESQSKFLWEGLSGHFISVVRVQTELRKNEKGFSFEYLDSFTGKREYGYISIDEARNFAAAKGDAENWTWIGNRPFLTLTAPSLRLLTQQQGFHQRTIITANYAILLSSCARPAPGAAGQ